MDMATLPIFISHNYRDKKIAREIGNTIERISLELICPWYSSDESSKGGLRPGDNWAIEIFKQLNSCRAILTLVTPNSMDKPWIYFESGVGAGKKSCEIIPICLGINSLNDVPFPLGLYQSYQLGDYKSSVIFFNKLFSRYEIKFDEGMVGKVIQEMVSNMNEILFAMDSNPNSANLPIQENSFENLKRHFDSGMNRIINSLSLREDHKDQLEYEVRIGIEIDGQVVDKYIKFHGNETVMDISDRIFYSFPQGYAPAFTYLEKWILIDDISGKRLVMREISRSIPAKYIFTPEYRWVVKKLQKPYSPKDSSDSHMNWY